ncbi:MAG: response regulator transcription factor [Akkermansiaceae bacterium]|nr:response regulator transcription factor [Akkermansiaceae bacterium]
MTTAPAQAIKIILIEDNPEYRRAISMTMERSKGYELVGKFGSAEQALAELQRPDAVNDIDIILLDLGLPKMQGLESMSWIEQYAPHAKIVVLTQSDKRADVIEAIQLGASGYLLKSASMQEIRDAISTVVQGGAILDPSIAKYLLDQIQNSGSCSLSGSQLSARELEVLEHISRGLLRKEIARALTITENTVVTHIRHIYDKLSVSNAPAAVRKAYESGILPIKEGD